LPPSVPFLSTYCSFSHEPHSASCSPTLPGTATLPSITKGFATTTQKHRIHVAATRRPQTSLDTETTLDRIILHRDDKKRRTPLVTLRITKKCHEAFEQ